ncbi:MAG: hypothetical protein RL120_10690 [Gammaproteobacteria bacterium]
MISTIIVGASLAMAALFTAAYLLDPALRRRVEAPKTIFLQQLRQYDQQLQQQRAARNEPQDDHNTD